MRQMKRPYSTDVSYKLCQWRQHLWDRAHWNFDDLDLSFSRSSKFQDQQINWMAKYDFLYLFHNMHHLEWPFKIIQGQRSWGQRKDHIWLPIMCFIETFGITCSCLRVLARIDHKGPNLTFLTLQKWHLYWFHSPHILSQYWHHPTKVIQCEIKTLVITWVAAIAKLNDLDLTFKCHLRSNVVW